ncbi:alcohol dehydrogenase catalytic domain-containing protein [Jatrophihabitans sp.]|uniref:alcohol dehydrogenase catalytic domain-containing protein n=1 Tax=Jatrophihabitans sp. TaxID=1932789 RepID=UPI002BE118DB|nr:alcohol dehydrogenase catalytic domain-containing protein [Jatrophihabitans sp.]
MRAATVPGFAGRWELIEVPMVSAGPGQVVIRVRASGLCHNDVLCGDGAFGGRLPMNPPIFGHEAAGEVVEVGAGVTTRKVGDRVGTTWVQALCGRCDYCRRTNPPLTGMAGTGCRGPAALSGLTVQGGHAEYFVATAASTVLLPDELSFDLAAPVLCAGYTAWSALRAGRPQPGERVAVVGIGGLGHLAVQFASACGYQTIAVTRTPDKHELISSLGADQVVADGKQLAEVGGADVILVTATAAQAGVEALPGLRDEGRLVMASIDPSGPFNLGTNSQLWARRQQIIGASHDGLPYLAEALDLVATGRVTPMIEQFPADRVNEAVGLLRDGRIRFRAVINY